MLKERDIDFLLLNVTLTHSIEVAALPFHHRDPFDRSLISQVICENMAIVTRDGNFSAYKVDLIW